MTDHQESQDGPAGRHEADMADDQLLDAILRGRAQDTTVAMNTRIARVMERVATTPRETPVDTSSDQPHRGFRLVTIGRAVAAAILFGALISLMLVVSRPQPAEATLLQRAIQRMGAEDLTYSITVASDPDASPEKRPLIDRKGARNRHPGSRAFAWKHAREDQGRRGGGRTIARLDGATLHTRGELWSLLVPTRNDRIYARGFDGENSWTNRPNDTPRARASSPVSGEDRANRRLQILDIALLDLSEMIIELDRSYEVSEPEIVDSQFDDSPLVRYEATRKPRARVQSPTRLPERNQSRTMDGEPRRNLFPQSIEIWADPESERIVFLRLSGLRSHGSEETVNLELALESTDVIPDDAFTRSGYAELSVPKRHGDRPSGDRRRDAEPERGRPMDRPDRGRNTPSMGHEP